MQKFRYQAKIWAKKNDLFIISEGRVQLLKLIEKYGSIKRAAEEMRMSYRHAWGIIKKINNALNENVVESIRGGEKGGRTVLTRFGKKLIEEYEGRLNAIDIIMRFGPRPAITVDGIITRKQKVLLIMRKNKPFQGFYAFPGGFVEYKEPVEVAVLREVEEETGLKTRIQNLIGVYSAPDRDPRGHTISVIYELDITGGRVKAGSDAKSIKWFNFDNLPELAFDHGQIIKDFLRYRGKKEKDR
jgi:8-oxo-dGTP diphosphatase